MTEMNELGCRAVADDFLQILKSEKKSVVSLYTEFQILVQVDEIFEGHISSAILAAILWRLVLGDIYLMDDIMFKLKIDPNSG